MVVQLARMLREVKGFTVGALAKGEIVEVEDSDTNGVFNVRPPDGKWSDGLCRKYMIIMVTAEAFEVIPGWTKTT